MFMSCLHLPWITFKWSKTTIIKLIGLTKFSLTIFSPLFCFPVRMTLWLKNLWSPTPANSSSFARRRRTVISPPNPPPPSVRPSNHYLQFSNQHPHSFFCCFCLRRRTKGLNCQIGCFDSMTDFVFSVYFFDFVFVSRFFSHTPTPPHLHHCHRHLRGFNDKRARQQPGRRKICL